MYKIEKLSKYVDWAEPEDEAVVFDTFGEFISQVKDGEIFKEYFKDERDAPCAPCVLKFVHNEEEAREFVKKAIEAGDEDFITVQQYADKDHYDGGAYGVLTGEYDGFARFSFTKQGYLLDNPLFD